MRKINLLSSLRKSTWLAAFAAVAALAPAGALAQTYPERAITLVVPYSPGGLNDRLARLIGPKLSERLGVPIVVENRPGAAAQVGTAHVVNSKPDGYTLLIGNSDGMTFGPATKSSVPYDVTKDFTYIGVIRNQSQLALALAPALEGTDIKAFLKRGREGRGLKHGTTGAGGTIHIQSLLLAEAAKLQVVDVPYKGMSGAVTALLGDQVDFVFITPSTVTPLREAGKVSVIAQSGPSRHFLLSDVPTLDELGVTGITELPGWIGVVGPAGIDDDIVATLRNAMTETMKDPELIETLKAQGEQPYDLPADKFESFVVDQFPFWEKFAVDNNLRK
jgi:tripartite-type tricarboxylate transporter receptor subunit TctC